MVANAVEYLIFTVRSGLACLSEQFLFRPQLEFRPAFRSNGAPAQLLRKLGELDPFSQTAAFSAT